jgi:hypothetical protein
MSLYTVSVKYVCCFSFLVFASLQLPMAVAWSNPSTFHTPGGRRKHVQPATIPPCDTPVIRDPPLTSHNMLRETAFSGFIQNQEHLASRKKTIKFSHSKTSNTDSFSAIPVANGLLSPQIVMRLEELTRLRRHHNPALDSFLDSYYTKGPMSCVPMLSDPDVLPHLTMAMRYVSA